MAAATRSGTKWQARAVREVSIPDSFPTGEEQSVECPLKAGDVIEMRSHEKGFRGAWFLCQVLSFKSNPTDVCPRITIQYVDYPDEKPSQVLLYQIDPNDKGTRRLMVRPVPPDHVRFGADDKVLKASSASLFKQEREYAKGDKVDAFVTECWWGGKIKAINGKKALIEWPPKPFGEGDKDLWIPLKDLRPSLRWASKKWHVPKCVKGPLGKIVVSRSNGSEAPASRSDGSDAPKTPTGNSPRKRPLERDEDTERSPKLPKLVHTPEPKRAGSTKPLEKAKGASSPGQKCTTCGAHETSYWRRGPLGKRTLCNKCGLAYYSHLKKNSKTATPHLSPVKKAATLVAEDSPEKGVPCPQKKCSECGTRSTLLWRKGPQGPQTLCNSCGMRFHEKLRQEKAAAQREAPAGGRPLEDSVREAPAGNEPLDGNRNESQQVEDGWSKGKCSKCGVHKTSKWWTGLLDLQCTACKEGRCPEARAPVQHKAPAGGEVSEARNLPNKPLKFVQATGAAIRAGVMQTAGRPLTFVKATGSAPQSRAPEPAEQNIEGEGLGEKGPWPGQKCAECGVCKSSHWRLGPKGPRTLCQKCGVRFANAKHLMKVAQEKQTAQRKASLAGERQKMLRLLEPIHPIPSVCEKPVSASAEEQSEKQTSVGQANEVPKEGLSGKGPWPGQKCSKCGVSASFCWRVGPSGPRTLCDKCGLRYAFLKHHARDKQSAQQKLSQFEKELVPKKALEGSEVPSSFKSACPLVPEKLVSASGNEQSGKRTSVGQENELPGEGLGGEGPWPGKKCAECGVCATLCWRLGPKGPRTLCKECGQKYSLRRDYAKHKKRIAQEHALLFFETTFPHELRKKEEKKEKNKIVEPINLERASPLVVEKPVSASAEVQSGAKTANEVSKDCPWPGQKCSECGTCETPNWQRGPLGDHTLCRKCGCKYYNKVREACQLAATAKDLVKSAAQHEESTAGRESCAEGVTAGRDSRLEGATAGRDLRAEGATVGRESCAEGVTAGRKSGAEGVTAGKTNIAEGVTAGRESRTEGATAGRKTHAEGVTAGKKSLAERKKKCYQCGTKDCSSWKTSPLGNLLCKSCWLRRLAGKARASDAPGGRSRLVEERQKGRFPKDAPGGSFAVAKRAADGAPDGSLLLAKRAANGVPGGSSLQARKAADSAPGDSTSLIADKGHVTKRGEPTKAAKQSERNVVEGFEESMRDFLKESSAPSKRPASARRECNERETEVGMEGSPKKAQQVKGQLRKTPVKDAIVEEAKTKAWGTIKCKGALQSSARIVKQSLRTLRTREKPQTSEKKQELEREINAEEKRSKRAELRRQKKRKIERLKDQLAISMETPERETKRVTRQGASSSGKRKRGGTEKTESKSGKKVRKWKVLDTKEVEFMGTKSVSKKRPKVQLRKDTGAVGKKDKTRVQIEAPVMETLLVGDGFEEPESIHARAESQLEEVKRRVKQRSEQTSQAQKKAGPRVETVAFVSCEEPLEPLQRSDGLQDRRCLGREARIERGERKRDAAVLQMETVFDEPQLERSEEKEDASAQQLESGASEQLLETKWRQSERKQQVERTTIALETGTSIENPFSSVSKAQPSAQREGELERMQEAESRQKEQEEVGNYVGGFVDEPFAYVDKEEALLMAQEQLAMWDEVLIDEIRGLFMMVNTWSPEENSLEDPLAWYHEKMEALVTRGERFLENGSGQNAGSFKSWIDLGPAKQPQSLQENLPPESTFPRESQETTDSPTSDADAPDVDAPKDSSPKTQPSDIFPMSVNASPVPLDALPEPSDVFPEPLKASPEALKASPELSDACPKAADASPEPLEAFPEPSDVFPEPLKASPEPSNPSREPSEVSPEPSDSLPEPKAPPAAQLMFKSLLEEYFAELSTEELVLKVPAKSGLLSNSAEGGHVAAAGASKLSLELPCDVTPDAAEAADVTLNGHDDILNASVGAEVSRDACEAAHVLVEGSVGPDVILAAQTAAESKENAFKVADVTADVETAAESDLEAFKAPEEIEKTSEHQNGLPEEKSDSKMEESGKEVAQTVAQNKEADVKRGELTDVNWRKESEPCERESATDSERENGTELESKKGTDLERGSGLEWKRGNGTDLEIESRKECERMDETDAGRENRTVCEPEDGTDQDVAQLDKLQGRLRNAGEEVIDRELERREMQGALEKEETEKKGQRKVPESGGSLAKGHVREADAAGEERTREEGGVGLQEATHTRAEEEMTSKEAGENGSPGDGSREESLDDLQVQRHEEERSLSDEDLPIVERKEGNPTVSRATGAVSGLGLGGILKSGESESVPIQPLETARSQGSTDGESQAALCLKQEGTSGDNENEDLSLDQRRCGRPKGSKDKVKRKPGSGRPKGSKDSEKRRLGAKPIGRPRGSKNIVGEKPNALLLLQGLPDIAVASSGKILDERTDRARVLLRILSGEGGNKSNEETGFEDTPSEVCSEAHADVQTGSGQVSDASPAAESLSEVEVGQLTSAENPLEVEVGEMTSAGIVPEKGPQLPRLTDDAPRPDRPEFARVLQRDVSPTTGALSSKIITISNRQASSLTCLASPTQQDVLFYLQEGLQYEDKVERGDLRKKSLTERRQASAGVQAESSGHVHSEEGQRALQILPPANEGVPAVRQNENSQEEASQEKDVLQVAQANKKASASVQTDPVIEKTTESVGLQQGNSRSATTSTVKHVAQVFPLQMPVSPSEQSFSSPLPSQPNLLPSPGPFDWSRASYLPPNAAPFPPPFPILSGPIRTPLSPSGKQTPIRAPTSSHSFLVRPPTTSRGSVMQCTPYPIGHPLWHLTQESDNNPEPPRSSRTIQCTRKLYRPKLQPIRGVISPLVSSPPQDIRSPAPANQSLSRGALVLKTSPPEKLPVIRASHLAGDGVVLALPAPVKSAGVHKPLPAENEDGVNSPPAVETELGAAEKTTQDELLEADVSMRVADVQVQPHEPNRAPETNSDPSPSSAELLQRSDGLEPLIADRLQINGPDCLDVLDRPIVVKASFRVEVEGAVSSEQKQLVAAAKWRRLAHSLLRVATLSSRLAELGGVAANGGGQRGKELEQVVSGQPTQEENSNGKEGRENKQEARVELEAGKDGPERETASKTIQRISAVDKSFLGGTAVEENLQRGLTVDERSQRGTTVEEGFQGETAAEETFQGGTRVQETFQEGIAAEEVFQGGEAGQETFQKGTAGRESFEGKRAGQKSLQEKTAGQENMLENAAGRKELVARVDDQAGRPADVTRVFGREEVTCGPFRGRWGPDGKWVWTNGKGRLVHFSSEAASAPSPRPKVGRPNLAAIAQRSAAVAWKASEQDNGEEVKRRKAHKQWEKRMDARMESIHTSLVRSKGMLKRLKDECEQPPFETALGVAPTPDVSTPKLTLLPDADVDKNESGEKVSGVNGRLSRRSKRKSKRLRINLGKHVCVDRTFRSLN